MRGCKDVTVSKGVTILKYVTFSKAVTVDGRYCHSVSRNVVTVVRGIQFSAFPTLNVRNFAQISRNLFDQCLTWCRVRAQILAYSRIWREFPQFLN
jgi:hypothetical protein